MIKRVCTFCNQQLGVIEDVSSQQLQISHGICKMCLVNNFSDCGEPLNEFLNSLPTPIFVINKDRLVEYANSKGQTLIGTENSDIKYQPGGDVFRCSYATLPEGCGKTVHCHSCTISNLVMETAETGESFNNVGAYIDIDGLAGIETVNVLISTEKIGQFVFLSINEIDPPVPKPDQTVSGLTG